MERVLREGAGELLEDIRTSLMLPRRIDESKVLAFSALPRADRTLTADEASAAREAAVAATVERWVQATCPQPGSPALWRNTYADRGGCCWLPHP